MKKNIRGVLSVFMFLILSGCASVSKMPLQVDNKTLDMSTKSILVAKIRVKNEHKPAHQPDLCCIFVNRNGKKFSYTKPSLVNELGEGGKEYFVSMDMEPGKATIDMARFVRQIPMLLMATADLPFEQEIDVPPNSIVYLGNITATIKAKSGDGEPSAGSVIPLVDQAVTGFSTGTFEVEVKDEYESDVQELHRRYSSLEGKDIVNMVLPAWVHPDRKNQPKLTATES